MSQAIDCLSPHIFHLNVTGYWRLNNEQFTKNQVTLHNLYRCVAFYIVTIHNIQEILTAVFAFPDLDKLVTASFILLTHLDAWSKLLVFRYRAGRVQKLLDWMNDPLFNQPDQRFIELKLETSRSARVLLKFYTGAAVATCILWAAFPLVDKYIYNTVRLALWFPYDITNGLVFELSLAYILCMNIIEGFSNTTMDAFISTIMAQCKTQVTILRMNLETLPETCWNLQVKYNTDYKTELKRRLVMCLNHYKIIIDMVTELEDIFSAVILFQFIVIAWIICMTAYKITDINPLTVEFVSAVLYMICLLVELFIYCYYGNELTVETDAILQSVYSMDWLETSTEFQRSLVIFMERAKRPVRTTAASLVQLSMATFMTILKSSYSFYALLKGTNTRSQ